MVCVWEKNHNLVLFYFGYSFQNMGIIHTAKKFLVSELIRKKTQLKKEEIKRHEGHIRKLTKKEEFEVNDCWTQHNLVQISDFRLNHRQMRTVNRWILILFVYVLMPMCILNMTLWSRFAHQFIHIVLTI